VGALFAIPRISPSRPSVSQHGVGQHRGRRRRRLRDVCRPGKPAARARPHGPVGPEGTSHAVVQRWVPTRAELRRRAGRDVERLGRPDARPGAAPSSPRISRIERRSRPFWSRPGGPTPSKCWPIPTTRCSSTGTEQRLPAAARQRHGQDVRRRASRPVSHVRAAGQEFSYGPGAGPCERSRSFPAGHS
jgi:hypothetical protein